MATRRYPIDTAGSERLEIAAGSTTATPVTIRLDGQVIWSGPYTEMRAKPRIRLADGSFLELKYSFWRILPVQVQHTSTPLASGGTLTDVSTLTSIPSPALSDVTPAPVQDEQRGGMQRIIGTLMVLGVLLGGLYNVGIPWIYTNGQPYSLASLNHDSIGYGIDLFLVPFFFIGLGCFTRGFYGISTKVILSIFLLLLALGYPTLNNAMSDGTGILGVGDFPAGRTLGWAAISYLLGFLCLLLSLILLWRLPNRQKIAR